MKIPSDWERKSLESVSHIQTGLAKGKTGLKNPVKKPFLRVANVQDSYFNLSDIHEIEIEQNQIERYELQFGDVVITEGGDADKLGRGHVWRNEVPGCIHQNHLFAIRAQRNELDFEFLSALISSKYGKAYFLSCAKQSTNLASINSSQLKAFPVLLPPLPEQRRIAAILSQWDDSLSILAKLIEAKSQQKRGLAGQLLTGKLRLKGFEGKWIKRPLSSLGKVIRGVSYKPEDLQESISSGSSYLLRSSNIQNSLINLENSYVVNSKRVSEKQILVDGDIVICMANGSKNLVGKNGVFRDPGSDKYAVGAFCAIVRPNSKLEGSYTYQLMQTSTYEEAIALGLSGSSINNLKNSDVEEIIFNLPTDHHEQRAIASILSTLDDEIATLNALKAKVQEQKRGLMDLLLTGQVRVKVEEAS